MRRPKISIMLITYNHEKYIAQALESILMQETEYDYEIAVIEDCSTDRTQEIIMQYVKQYPDKVKPYFNEKNLGNKVTQKNFYQGYFRLTGEYMAILEGDDYWTSPHKLQKQVSFLEANPEYVACAHNTIKIYEDGSKQPHRFLYFEGTPLDHAIDSLILMTSYFHTTTLLFRNVFCGAPPKHFRNPWSCEIFITIAHAQYGKIRYFNEDMAAYRAHVGGVFSNMGMLEGWFFNIGGLRRYNQWLGYRYLQYFSLSIIRYCNNLLSDKGKQAALPTNYQYFKYLSIRTVYQIIHYILYGNVVVRILSLCYNKSKQKHQSVYKRALATLWLLFYVICYHVTKWSVVSIYTVINGLLPSFVRNQLKKIESRYAVIKKWRMFILFGNKGM